MRLKKLNEYMSMQTLITAMHPDALVLSLCVIPVILNGACHYNNTIFY